MVDAPDADGVPETREMLIGENDVLAAITCEYLDVMAPRKDTAAAAVALGRVRMTTFRFSFAPDPREMERARTYLLGRSDAEIASFFSVPLGCIASVQRKGAVVELFTKDLRHLAFRFDAVEVTQVSKRPSLPWVVWRRDESCERSSIAHVSACPGGCCISRSTRCSWRTCSQRRSTTSLHSTTGACVNIV